MAENLILLVPDRVYAVDKLHILRENRSDREGMDSCTAAFFLLQSSASRDGVVDGNILESIHLLEICTQSHEKKARQGDMIFLTEVHQTFCGLFFQVENIQSGFCIVGGIESRTELGIFEHLSCRFQFVSSMDAAVNWLAFFNFFLEIFDISL